MLGVRSVVDWGVLVLAQVVDENRPRGARRRDDFVVLRQKPDLGPLRIVNDALVGSKTTVDSLHGVLA